MFYDLKLLLKEYLKPIIYTYFIYKSKETSLTQN